MRAYVILANNQRLTEKLEFGTTSCGGNEMMSCYFVFEYHAKIFQRNKIQIYTIILPELLSSMPV